MLCYRTPISSDLTLYPNLEGFPLHKDLQGPYHFLDHTISENFQFYLMVETKMSNPLKGKKENSWEICAIAFQGQRCDHLTIVWKYEIMICN